MDDTAPPSREPAVLCELGRGGVGVVHLVRRADGAVVVRKTLRPELARNVAVRRMFVEEARVASRIHDPHVAEVVATGFDPQGHPFIEMEWARGGSLQAISDATRLDDRLYARLVADVLLALSAAHRACGEDGASLGLVHRDVSPHNVIVTSEGIAKLIDFGIAKVRDGSLETSTGVVKGKARYLSPEQAAREPVGPRADVFAVGVILFQHLACRRLWEGMSEPEVFHCLVEGKIPELASYADDARPDVAAFVGALLARSPDARPEADEASARLLALYPPEEGDREAIGAVVARVFAAELSDLDAKLTPPRDTEEGGDAVTGPAPVPEVASSAPTRRWRVGALVVLSVALVGGGLAVRARLAPPAVRPAPSVATGAPRCTADEACEKGAHCTDVGACESLVYEGCSLPDVGASRSKRALYIGTMFPLSGKDGPAYGQSNQRSAELAALEVNRLAGGVATAEGPRPIAIVACDDAERPEERARFLSTHVPAVVGFRSSDEALTLVREVFRPRGTLVVSALNASPLLAQMPAGNPRLFYRVAASATALAEPMAKATKLMLAEEARRRHGIPAAEPVRVAVVREGNATGVAYADKVLRALDGQGLDVREIALGAASAEAVRRAAIDAIVAFAPNVVLALGDGMIDVVVPVDARSPKARRPLYLATTPWEGPDVVATLVADPSRKDRLFAMSWPTSHRPLLGYVERTKEAFGEVLTPSTASPGPYDALYLVAYAAAAARGGSLDGVALARAVPRLLPGAGKKRVPVGPAEVVSGLAIVADGGAIDLEGVSSRLDFDLATGDSPVDAVVLCTTFDTTTKTLDARDLPIAAGKMSCPPGRANAVP